MGEPDRVTIAIDIDVHRELHDAKPYGKTLREFTEDLLIKALDDLS